MSDFIRIENWLKRGMSAQEAVDELLAEYGKALASEPPARPPGQRIIDDPAIKSGVADALDLLIQESNKRTQKLNPPLTLVRASAEKMSREDRLELARLEEEEREDRLNTPEGQAALIAKYGGDPSDDTRPRMGGQEFALRTLQKFGGMADDHTTDGLPTALYLQLLDHRKVVVEFLLRDPQSREMMKRALKPRGSGIPNLTGRSTARYIAAVAAALLSGELPPNIAGPLLYAAQLQIGHAKLNGLPTSPAKRTSPAKGAGRKPLQIEG